ncbi:MAG TPA: O-antigen ligase family protein [Patescibacteria group bacterium]|nr:O-antigen ligase family protein [Patescibacteria group bacterium]
MIKRSRLSQQAKAKIAFWSSPHDHKTLFFSVERFFFFLTLLFIPIQLGKHFWPSFAFINGIGSDYLSPTLYITDLTVFFLIVCFICRTKAKPIFVWSKKHTTVFVLTALVLLISTLNAKSIENSLFGVAKLCEMVFFGWYIAIQKFSSYKHMLLISLVLGVSFSSVLAVAQFLLQGSAGGILYFFGERTFSAQTPGIANAALNGQLVMRPYATFPHPNVLAGYLLITVSILCGFFIRTPGRKRFLIVLAIVLGSTALFVTMSRVVILLWIVFFAAVLLYKKRVLFWIFLTGLSGLFLTPLRFRYGQDLFGSKAFQERIELITYATQLFSESLLTGVGIKNFLVSLPFVVTKPIGQPVHNIYILAAVEIGLLGLALFLWMFGKTTQRLLTIWKETLNQSTIYFIRVVPFISVCIIGLVDHYLITLQQGQLLLVLVIGLCWSDE